MAQQPTFKLNNGYLFPKVGLGTWTALDGECEQMVYDAIKLGYRHIDTAAIYQNESTVGKGIKKALDDKLVTRDELFVVTKLWNDRHGDVDVAMNESLTKLGLDYVDLYLVHWPVAWQKGTNLVDENDKGLLVLWDNMQKLVDDKKTRSIGVSNYNEAQITETYNYARIKPVVNQVEIHPYFNNFKLQKVCNELGIYLTAYSALMPQSTSYKFSPWRDITAEPLVQEIVKKYDGKYSPQQILLNWQLAVGNSVITKSSKMERLQQNFNIITFQLDNDDLAKLNSFKPIRYRNPHDFLLPKEEWFFKDE